jgi:hypothetical protein
LVWTSTALVMLTGTVYLWMKYWLPPLDEFSIIHHPLQPLMLKLHVLTAPLLVFALGSIGLRHVWRHFAAGTGQGRLSGLSTASVVIPMIITGYLIQTITGENLLQVAVLVHLVTGIIYGAALLVHQVIALRGRRSVGEVIARGDRRRRRSHARQRR